MPQQAAKAQRAPAQEPAPDESAAEALAPQELGAEVSGLEESGAIHAGPPARRWTPRHTYGAIDLGTNNCRLLVARPTDDGFTVIDAFSRVVRMGEGMATSGKLSEAAMDRAVVALGVCAEKLRRRRVSLARSVATEACRRAVNGRHFVERVRRETGICLEIISPEEEARLAMLGCHRLLEPGDGPALIFDIGGGSTELILIDTDGGEPRIKCWWSAPWGVVSLTESEGRDFPDVDARRAAYGRMRERVRHAFRHFTAMLPADKTDIRLMGTSGTVTTLASVYLALPSYDRRAVDGLKMPASAMRNVAETLSGMDHAGRATFPCIGHERADLVVAGCAILEAIMDIWPAETLGVADRGIREGILRSLMARDGHEL